MTEMSPDTVGPCEHIWSLPAGIPTLTDDGQFIPDPTFTVRFCLTCEHVIRLHGIVTNISPATLQNGQGQSRTTRTYGGTMTGEGGHEYTPAVGPDGMHRPACSCGWGWSGSTTAAIARAVWMEHAQKGRDK